MRMRTWSTLAFTLLVFSQMSCAVGGGMTPLDESMPAARAGLRPEYRIFYDALQDYGDWTLIEPYGYVFRPWENDITWRPYADGFWAPSDVYGWVWVSAEPFGWATYHYGEWIYDRYQGWVWIPGLDWGPAWVNWQWTPDYVGWSPMSPPGYSSGLVPGGSYVYVPTGALPSSDLRAQIRTQEQLGAAVSQPHPIERLEKRDGVTFNAGPAFEMIEKLAGPLHKVKIQDVLPGEIARTKETPAPAGPSAQGRPEVQRGPAGPLPRTPAEVQAMREAGEEAAREARRVADSKGATPPSIRLVRPSVKPGPGRDTHVRDAVDRIQRRAKPAAADSTRKE